MNHIDLKYQVNKIRKIHTHTKEINDEISNKEKSILLFVFPFAFLIYILYVNHTNLEYKVKKQKEQKEKQ